MTRRHLTWGLSLGLMLTGWLLAHSLAYRVAFPDGEQRRHMLAESGHGYLDTAPLLSLALVLVALAFAGSVLARAGRAPVEVPLWVFAVVPPGGFAVQEHLERGIHTGTVPYLAALEPTFVMGFLLQLPLALAAFLLARALLACAGTLGLALGGGRGPRLAPFVLLARPLPAPARPCGPLLSSGRGQRGPPSSARS